MLYRGSGGQGWVEFTAREVGAGAGSNSQGSGNGGQGWVEFTVKVGAGAGSNSMDKMCRHNSAHMVARMNLHAVDNHTLTLESECSETTY